jgi:hypothetical protein
VLLAQHRATPHRQTVSLEIPRRLLTELAAQLLITLSGNEDDWDPLMGFIQLGLEFETRNSGHTNIGDQTCRMFFLTGA